MCTIFLISTWKNSEKWTILIFWLVFVLLSPKMAQNRSKNRSKYKIWIMSTQKRGLTPFLKNSDFFLPIPNRFKHCALPKKCTVHVLSLALYFEFSHHFAESTTFKNLSSKNQLLCLVLATFFQCKSETAFWIKTISVGNKVKHCHSLVHFGELICFKSCLNLL